MKKAILIMISLVITLATVTVAGCGPAEVKEPPDQVSVRLKWIHQAQSTGFYTAEQQGFYTEENIDVTLKAGGPDIPLEKTIADLITGDITFAIRGADEIIKSRAEGNPFVAIAVIYQKNPNVYMSLKDSGIQRPQDFVGKRVMVSSTVELQHNALLKKLGINPAAIEYVPYSNDAMALVNGQTDVHCRYGTNGAIALRKTGYDVNIIWLVDYGISFYADTIITSEKLVQENPELVERFLRATLKGYRYAIENQSEAVDMSLQYDPTLDRDIQIEQMEAQTPLIHTGETPIGWMDASVWEYMYQTLLENGMLKQPINIDETYTMEFLNKIYGKAE